MQIYHITTKPFSGTDYREVYFRAYHFYRALAAQTKRRPYVKSKYFKKQKVFLGIFWQHLFKKILPDRTRRMKYFPCAIDLIKNSSCAPTSKINPNDQSEILHRFYGKTFDGKIIAVQIKEDRATTAKYLISIFPIEN